MDFDSAAFVAATPRERLAMCQAFSTEAQGLAAKADEETRVRYAELARAWTTLASEIERSDGAADEVR